MNFRIAILALGAASASLALPASAQEWYAGGSVGYVLQNDSSNAGETGAFTTGNGAPVIPFGSPIAAGTAYGWDTEFDNGYALSGEFGARYANGFRSGVELVYSKADVDTHSGVNVAGTVIDGVDAAVLTGSPTQLGATVGQVVATPDGDEIESTSIFANLYYDFNREGRISPYVGAGLGYSDVSVQYSPSGVGIIDDSKGKFAYQLKAGATLAVSERIDLFGEAAYRATDDVKLENTLFPGTLNIENTQTVFSVGARYRFGS
ncbi:MAG: outer membrane beta-barrel protein [Hyphomonas sp.]|jgi:opacity protein-like surface antigen|nr:outer membrane beta-barrel protein [Hyphomonas sp.]